MSTLKSIKDIFDHVFHWEKTKYVQLVIEGHQAGYTRPDVASLISTRCQEFSMNDGQLQMNLEAGNYIERTKVFREVAELLAQEGYIRPLREENYLIEGRYGFPLAEVDRATSVALGIHTRGVHLNGTTIKNNEHQMWIARRADHVAFPGQLDNLVGGGQPTDIMVEANLIKEGDEEAGMTANLMQKALPRSIVHYRFDGKSGLVSNTMYIYDLHCPENFLPVNQDKSVQEFFLMHPQELLEEVLKNTFKFNSALVVLDWLARAGELPPDICNWLEPLYCRHRLN